MTTGDGTGETGDGKTPRLAATFTKLRRRKKKALIPYITAGDPRPAVTAKLMHKLVEAGADIIELGVPFSDPMADGPVIQAACERALKHHIGLRDILGLVTEFRTQNTQTPVVLMGYLNPVERMGRKTFAAAAQKAGVDGVLVVDLAVEEADAFVPVLRQHRLDPIFLLAPTSPDERIARVAAQAGGYIYYVSLKGVTGSHKLDVGAVAAKLTEIRRHSRLPVAVGFGIRDAGSAALIAKIADGVIVGSALVSRIGELCDDEAKLLREVPALLAGMRQAMDSVSP
ncbi:MAG: tryptophan synthase subunit alpha [Nevskiales bacterium]